MTTKGYIFDYGGTLDTGGCHWGKMFMHAYEHLQVPASEAELREAYVHVERKLGSTPVIQPDFTFRKTLETKIGLQLEYLSADSAYLNPLVSQLYDTVCHFTSQSRDVLSQLKLHCPMVLVSNFYGNIHPVLREFGLDALFDTVIESAVVGVRKPDPRIYALGLEALHLQPGEVVVVGDSIDKDILPAKSLGCQTVWIKGEGWTDAPVDETVPDAVIHHIGELLLR